MLKTILCFCAIATLTSSYASAEEKKDDEILVKCKFIYTGDEQNEEKEAKLACDAHADEYEIVPAVEEEEKAQTA